MNYQKNYNYRGRVLHARNIDKIIYKEYNYGIIQQRGKET